MKTKLLLSIAICVSAILNSQNVWTGTQDDLWSNENNWSGNVPDNSDDVLIPPGFVVTIDTPATILSIEVQGNSTLNVTETITIQNPSEFEDNVVVNWVSGDLIGPGILLNSGTINLTFPSFDLGGSTVLNNPGVINLSSGANIFIGVNCVLNNSGTGVIDFKEAGSDITGSTLPNTLNNFGTIKTSMPDPMDTAFIGCQLINTDGVFQIDSGIMNINTIDANFMNGQYNVAANATLNWNDAIDISGVLTGNVQGALNWVDDLNVATTAVFNFTGTNAITNIGGDLYGGGTLTNLSTINLETGNLVVHDGSTINNEGTISLTNGSDLLINSNGIVNNTSSGIVSFLSDGGNIANQGIANDTRILNNEGLIQVSLPNASDEASVLIKLNNNDGQIDVNNGTLNLNYSGITLTNGDYNIGVNGILNWSFPITLSGTMSGVLDGVLNWDADLIVPSSGSFNFSGNGFINWESSDLNGGGTFTNKNQIIKPAGGARRIDNASIFNNNGTVSLQGGGSIAVTTNSILNNNAEGVISLEIGNSSLVALGALPNTINNFGTIESNVTGSAAVISAQLINSGVLDIKQNGLVFNGAGSLTNSTTGMIKGNGSLTLTSDPADFINNGVIAPGASPGNLTIVNEYSSSSSATLQVELNGNDQGVDYDLLTVDGDASLEGGIDIILGFAPNINDEFIVLDTAGPGDSIDLCDLPASASASFGGTNYEFSIACRNGNEVVLTVTNETLSLDDLNSTSFNLYPNPTSSTVTVSGGGISQVVVYDINARRVLTSNSSIIDFTLFENGVYFLKILDTNNRSVIKKLIKN
ncbi:MAG: T9SS type A sorting domain-containing protein [bacterium]